MTLPVTIIGGYLGAGKTTLVNHLLRNANGKRLAVLVNEFGELPIDEDLIEARDDNMISIAGGCVCCSYGNDLTLAMMDMAKLDPPPDHVLLESSGVALPGAIAASVSLLPDFEVDGTLVLADAETIRAQSEDTYIGDTIERQIDDADLIVLNKSDLVSDENLLETTSWLKNRNRNIEVVPALNGFLPPEVVFMSTPGMPENHPDSPTPTHVHVHDLFSSVSITVAPSVDPERLAKGLADEHLGLVRAKGFVTDADGSSKTIQVVGRRWSVSGAPDGAKPGFVAIGLKSGFDERNIRELLENCAV